MIALEIRNLELAKMKAAKAEAVANGDHDVAAIYETAIATLSDQLASYTTDEDEFRHFRNADGFTAARTAEIEIALLLDLKGFSASFEKAVFTSLWRGEISDHAIFRGLFLALKEDPSGDTIEAYGEKIAIVLDGDHIVLTGEDGFRRSFPTAELITEDEP